VPGGRPGLPSAPINCAELRPRDLPAQDLELVPQHQQLDVLQVQAGAAANKCSKESPRSELEKRKGHAADPPGHRP
jgi:hypothetical protein